MQILGALCQNEQEGRSLINTLVNFSVSGRNLCGVIVVHDDIEDDQTWLTSLSHKATSIVTINRLKTGKSADIEAQVNIFRRKILVSNNLSQKLGYADHVLSTTGEPRSKTDMLLL